MISTRFMHTLCLTSSILATTGTVYSSAKSEKKADAQTPPIGKELSLSQSSTGALHDSHIGHAPYSAFQGFITALHTATSGVQRSLVGAARQETRKLEQGDALPSPAALSAAVAEIVDPKSEHSRRGHYPERLAREITNKRLVSQGLMDTEDARKLCRYLSEQDAILQALISALQKEITPHKPR